MQAELMSSVEYLAFSPRLQPGPCSPETTCKTERSQKKGLFPDDVHSSGYWEESLLFMSEPPHSMECLHEALPLTCSVVEDSARRSGLRVLRVFLLQVDGPETHIPMHGSSEQGRLRLHCPFKMPPDARSLLALAGSAIAIHAEGNCFWFDATVDHDLTYTSPSGLAGYV